MPTYFIPFEYTGVIGLISAILSGVYTYGIGLIFNFAIQRSKQSDLRLRIATTYGLFGLVKEIANSGKGPLPNKAAILCTILFLTLAGKSISFIVTTGIKASTGIQLGALETVGTRLGTSTLELSTRGGNLSVLQSIYDFQTNSVGTTVNFEALANSAPIRVAEVATSNEGRRQDSFGPGTPGTFAFFRQMYRFGANTASCETTSRCALKMANTTLDPKSSSPATMLDAPFNVYYLETDGELGSQQFGVVPPVRVGAQVIVDDTFSEYLAERPHTVIRSYTDVNGTSAYAAITTASFQLKVPETSKRFVNVAQQLIGSSNRHYPAIFTALNASMPTVTETGAVLVFNNVGASTNNLTHVLCIGHTGGYFGDDHQPGNAQKMISCRETRITVMANKDFKAKVEPEVPPPVESNPTVGEDQQFDDPRLEYQEPLSFPYGAARILLTMYNAQSPTLMTLKDIIIGNLTVDSLDEIDQGMPALLKYIADRVAPLNSEFVAKVVPYKTVPGIQVELWAIVFIAIVVLIVVVLFALDRFMNDAVSRASVTTLIEHSTAQEELLAKGKKTEWEETDYSSWALVKKGDSYQVTLRREHIGVLSDETRKIWHE